MTTPLPASRSLPRAWLAALALALAAVALAALPPFVGTGLRGVLMALFDPLCHQLPSRSFHVGGVPFALCHRCFGIAAGLAAGLALAPLVRHRLPAVNGADGLLWIALGALPIGLDWGLEALGLWANTPGSRLLSGASFGLVAGVVIAHTLMTPRPTVAPAVPPAG